MRNVKVWPFAVIRSGPALTEPTEPEPSMRLC